MLKSSSSICFPGRAMEAPKLSVIGTNWPDMGHVSTTEPIVDEMSKYWVSSKSRGELESKNEVHNQR